MLRTLLALLALAVVMSTTPALADDALDRLAAAVQRSAATPQAERAVVDRMAKALTTTPDALRAQRAASALGWGDLYIAHRIAARGGHAVDKVVGARKSGAGWSQIAEEARVEPTDVAQDVLGTWPELAPPKPAPAPAARAPEDTRRAPAFEPTPDSPADEVRERMLRGGGMRGR